MTLTPESIVLNAPRINYGKAAAAAVCSISIRERDWCALKSLSLVRRVIVMPACEMRTPVR